MAAVARPTTAVARSRCLLVLSLAALASTARVDGAATAPAPVPSVDCTDALLSLAGCLSYVQEGSTAATPDPTCCSGLKDVVRKEVACLCQAFQGGQNFGIALNMTKALQLPGACKVKTPPFSKCHVSVPGVTGEAPAPAPSSGAPFFGQSPSSASSAGTGSDSTTPAPSPVRSDAVSLSASTQTFFAAATVAAPLLVYRVLGSRLTCYVSSARAHIVSVYLTTHGLLLHVAPVPRCIFVRISFPFCTSDSSVVHEHSIFLLHAQ